MQDLALETQQVMEREPSLELTQFRQRNPAACSEDIARFVEKVAVAVGRKVFGDFLNSSNNPLNRYRGKVLRSGLFPRALMKMSSSLIDIAGK